MKTLALVPSLMLLVQVLASPPTFSPGSDKYVVLPEDAPLGCPVKNFTVTDTDPGDSIHVFATDLKTRDYVYLNISQNQGNSVVVSLGLKTKLDRDEGTTNERLSFTATDTVGNEAIMVFTLYIQDVNDNPPVFQNLPYRLDIHENNDTGKVYFKVSATDKDGGLNGYVTYRMEPDSQSPTTAAEYNQTFSISNVTGDVTLLKKLDYEKNSYYQFTVIAQDMTDPYHNATTLLIIRVLDVQDTPPFFTGIPYRTTILENITIGAHVITVSATDGDPGVSNKVEFRKKDGDCSSYFNISESGDITTAQDMNRDIGMIKTKSGVCTFTVEAYEINGTYTQYGDSTATTDVTVNIDDVNDNSPQFENNENNTMIYEAEILENTPEGVPITLINPASMTVCDNDQGNNSRMTLSLTTSDFEISPTIVQDSGLLTIKVKNPTVLDFEERKNITFQVFATETANESHVATATVIVYLNDTNDNNPLFGYKSYLFYIYEGSANGTSVGTIKATDRDSGANGRITYSLSGGKNQFFIDPQTGAILTNCNGSFLDREKMDVYYLTVIATDGGGRSNATSVEIHLNDTNDNQPIFQRQEYIVSIYENDNNFINTPLITITATDADLENTENSKIRYSVVDVSDSSVRLRIDENGNVYLNASVNYEDLEDKAGGQVSAIIIAEDSGDPVQINNVTLKLDIQDLNDNSPVFHSAIFYGSVFENETSDITNHFVVTKVNATDADGTPRNNEFDYFIIGGSLDKFSINPSNGEIYITPNAVLDRETLDFYNITVTAIDHGSPPRNGSAFVYVTIIDVNDVLPKFNDSYSVRVKENQTTINAVTCEAFDEDENSRLEYTITKIEAFTETGQQINSLLVGGYFSIDPSNGTVSVHEIADREVAQEYRIQVTVQDLNAFDPSPQSATTTLTVTLIDINDNHPAFDDGDYSFRIQENAADSSIITTIHATDKDVNRTISYEITNASHYADSFEIDTSSGVLRKSGYLDRETYPSVELEITATDSGVPSLNTTKNILILVSDFNDNAPVFNSHSDFYHVAENQTPGTVIATINATDKDNGSNADITYSILGGPFSVDEQNGTITLNGTLDRENKTDYRLTVTAKDNPVEKTDQKTNTTTINIIIDDINDCPPKFQSRLYETSVKENVEINYPIIQTRAIDDDQRDTDNSKVSYEIIEGNHTLFKINNATGQIRNKASMRDHVGNYTLTIMAKDHGNPQLNSTTTVNIQVTDVNLHNPKLEDKLVADKTMTYECARINSPIVKFNATDADHGDNAKLNYTIGLIDSNKTVTDFWIGVENGTLYTKKLLKDTGGVMHKLQLVVSDNGVPSLSSQAYVFTVEILDVNDHDPEFTQPSFSMQALENHINETVGIVTAVDIDKNSNSSFKIEGEWADYFCIDDNGTITTAKELDRENFTSVQFNVTVKDRIDHVNRFDVCDNFSSSTDSSRQQALVHVTILDIDDNPPVFTNKEIQVGMRRNVQQGSTLNLQLKDGNYVTDRDLPENGRNKWRFKNDGEVTLGDDFKGTVKAGSGIRACEDNITHIFCVSSNGTVVNNYWFNEDMSGFFWVPVIVVDGAGNDTARIKIYLIADSQVLLMTVYGRKAEVANQINEILKMFSDITNHHFVYDEIADHKTEAGTVDSLWTDLFFHVVEPVTDRILSAPEAQRLVDKYSNHLVSVRERFKISQIVSSVRAEPEAASSEKTIYILVAVSVVLTLTLCITIYLFCSSVSRYRRKLKAATVSTTDKNMQMKEMGFEIPGSNQYSKQNNPLLNAEEPKLQQYDSMSLSSENSLDANEVDAAHPDTVYDTMEEKEMTMDLYNDDDRVPIPAEDPLSAALRLHEQRRLADNLDRRSTEDSEDGLVKMNGDVSHEKVTLHGFINEAFEHLEHSEI